MSIQKKRRLAKEIFEGQLTEQQIIEKLKIDPKSLRPWLTSKHFQQELTRLCEQAMQETKLTLTRFAPSAAIKLVELVNSEKPDIVRRAALDLIEHGLKSEQQSDTTEPDTIEELADEQIKQKLKIFAQTLK